jgi:hypothetical protein
MQFLVSVPSFGDLDRLDGIQMGVPSFSSTICISAWRSAEVPHKAELEKVWLHVDRVPHTLRHFLGLWAVGSLVGKTVDVDLVSLRRRAVVRIQVAMLQAGVLGDPSDEARPIAKADAVVKFKAFEFRFRREPADYIPEPDFVPLIWVKKDDSDEGGEGAPDGGDDAMDTSEPRLGPSVSGTSQVQQGGPSSSAPRGAQAMAPVYAVTPFNPNPKTPFAIEAVKRLRAISPSLEAPPSGVASPRVSADALRLALDAVSSVSPLPSSLVGDRPRLDRPARGRVCTLARTTPAAARRAAASEAARVGALDGARASAPALGEGAGEAGQRGGSSSPLPPRTSPPSPSGWDLRRHLPPLRSLVGVLPRLCPLELQLRVTGAPWPGRPLPLLLLLRWRRCRLHRRWTRLPSRRRLCRPWVWLTSRRCLPWLAAVRGFLRWSLLGGGGLPRLLPPLGLPPRRGLQASTRPPPFAVAIGMGLASMGRLRRMRIPWQRPCVVRRRQTLTFQVPLIIQSLFYLSQHRLWLLSCIMWDFRWVLLLILLLFRLML